MKLPLTSNDVEFKLEVLPEHIHPNGCFATGDDQQDKAIVAKIIEDSKWNECAWFCARCVATFTTEDGVAFEGDDYLGGCSYGSREQFMEPGGYWDDMKDSALARLNDEIVRIATAIEGLTKG